MRLCTIAVEPDRSGPKIDQNGRSRLPAHDLPTGPHQAQQRTSPPFPDPTPFQRSDGTTLWGAFLMVIDSGLVGSTDFSFI